MLLCLLQVASMGVRPEESSNINSSSNGSSSLVGEFWMRMMEPSALLEFDSWQVIVELYRSIMRFIGNHALCITMSYN